MKRIVPFFLMSIAVTCSASASPHLLKSHGHQKSHAAKTHAGHTKMKTIHGHGREAAARTGFAGYPH